MKDHPIMHHDGGFTMTHSWRMTDYQGEVPPKGADIPTRKFRDGDRFTLSADMVIDILESTQESDLEWVAGKYRIGRAVTLKAQRSDRASGRLCMGFDDEGVEPRWNMSVLEHAGFVWDEPEFPELEILECPDEFLDETELVLKGMVKEACHPNEELTLNIAASYVDWVQRGMARYGIVFYRP